MAPPDSRVAPNQVIRADLAHAMVDVGIRDRSERKSSMFENRDIRAMRRSLDTRS
jgi:hypothetical protein